MENNGEGVRKGAWTREEDILLRDCVDKFGEGKWHLVPLRAGLNRCRKSCRLRWLNYLRPNLKRGYFNKDEVDLIVRLHKLLGNRWSLIAGRLPGRTANDVKNFWNTHISKKPPSPAVETRSRKTITQSNIVRPRPRSFSNLQLHALSTQLNRSTSSAPLIHSREDNDYGDPTMNQLTCSSAPSNVEKEIHRTNRRSDENPNSSLQEDLDQCIRWWGDLLEMTENGEETTFMFPDEEATFLDGIRDFESNSAVHDELCGGLSLGGDHMELEQFIDF